MTSLNHFFASRWLNDSCFRALETPILWPPYNLTHIQAWKECVSLIGFRLLHNNGWSLLTPPTSQVTLCDSIVCVRACMPVVQGLPDWLLRETSSFFTHESFAGVPLDLIRVLSKDRLINLFILNSHTCMNLHLKRVLPCCILPFF